MQAASFLRNVPVLAGLSDRLLDRLVSQVQERFVRAGEWIVREGETADSMFIVRSGRVEVVNERSPGALIRILRRGDVLGELALLREGTRSASARASRDTELFELRRDAFEALIQEAPTFALGLTRAIGAQLAVSRTPVVTAAPARTIAVVALDDAVSPVEVAESLADALALYGSVVRLSAGEIQAIDQAERDADRVVMRGGSDPDQEWTGLCVREAHLVVAVTSGTPSPTWLRVAAALERCELIVFGPAVSPSVIAELQPREVQVITDAGRRPAALQATARRIAGRSVGVVLSGGGARALTHLGVIEELRASGVQIDRVAGASMGSLVAATTAIGLGPDAAYEAFERGAAINPTSDYTIPAFSLVRGRKLRRLILDEVLGSIRIEEAPLRFFCVSCDVVAREPVVHRTGPMVDAVYASVAIPGLFPPVPTADGKLLVDGGVLDNLPVATMARTGEGPVIAVDVTGRIGSLKRVGRPGLEPIGRCMRRLLTGIETPLPRIGETLMRTLMVGSSDTVAAARRHADLVIAPVVEGVGLAYWQAIARAREIGRGAAREALASNPDLASRFAS